MRFATICSMAVLASTALAMPTNELSGKGYGYSTKSKHEASPTSPPRYTTTTPIKVSPTLPTSYKTGGKSTKTSYGGKPTTTSYGGSPTKTSYGGSPTKTSYGGSPTKTSKGGVPVKTPGHYNGGHDDDDHENDCPSNCITDQQAEQGAEIFRQLIQNYTDTLALAALTPDFEDYSSSVNMIRNRGNKGPIQVNGISFTSREDFMNAQGAQPQIPFDTLNVFHGCDSITVRWQTTDSAAGKETRVNDIPAPGIGLLQTIPATDNEYGFRIKTLYSEFNAAAWLVNLGVFTPTPVAATKRDLPHIAAI